MFVLTTIAVIICCLKVDFICNFLVYYTVPFGLSLFRHFWASLFNFLNYFVWLRITDEGSVPEMRIWTIVLIKSDLKWWKHCSRSLFLYYLFNLVIITKSYISERHWYQSDLHISLTDQFEDWQPFGPSTIGCGPGFITGFGGVVTSPGYPDDFPAMTRCTWIIKVKSTQKVLLTLVDMDIYSSSRLIHFYH